MDTYTSASFLAATAPSFLRARDLLPGDLVEWTHGGFCLVTKAELTSSVIAEVLMVHVEWTVFVAAQRAVTYGVQVSPDAPMILLARV